LFSTITLTSALTSTWSTLGRGGRFKTGDRLWCEPNVCAYCGFI